MTGTADTQRVHWDALVESYTGPMTGNADTQHVHWDTLVESYTGT
jgi:hypothetical protein